ncbi:MULTISPECIES: MFS transporter [Clostridium]|uniref:MFS transporter n=1 Tax=Clostridium frigoriphilum TaxID=443253 RepID=A0ABU7UVK2_9CLOT|nr:MFS transporter [Clostridium sp. DSM 17811]MBU3102043.1 MFS transporter [Clostridium sp. DSM 17811]
MLQTEIPNTNISKREKIQYGFGDLACNLVYASISSYLLFFYTDVFGLASGVAAFMFFIVRIFDAISDPIIGIIIDKTDTKYGKFRPFLLYGAVPFCILAILCFSTPQLAMGGKVIYAYATYIALSVCYTFVNVPYGALTSAMTRDQQESVSITTYRTFLANIGQVIVSFCVPLLAGLFANSMSIAKSWQLTMVIIATIGGILLLICFKGTKERVRVPASHKKIKASDIFEQLKVNRPLLILSIFFLIIYGVKSVVSSTGIYYITYYVGRPELVKWYAAIGTLPALFIIPFIPWLSRTLTKKQLMSISILTDIVGMIGLFVVPSTWIVAIFVSRGIASVGNGMISAFMWALIPEVVEYGEWKTNKRLGGMIYAIIGFFFKCGNALGGMIPGVVLAMSGYVAHTTQTTTSLHGILIATSVVPICLYTIAIFCIRFYSLDKETYARISKELVIRNNLEFEKEKNI